ncbi:MAG TPA: shikimate kinase [Terriglobales bacterium]|nr:shikimate kinase [Terriglobales bacterium]
MFLVGFMGAGKSSVGQALARRLGWPFEDLDQRIVTGEKRSIEEIFRESGEAAFRQAEHKALAELVAELGSGPRVVALGGGTMVQPGNAALLEQAKAHLVFLDAPVEELFRRCQQEAVERPLGKDADQFSRLYQDRRPHYGKAAARIETSGKTIEAVAAEIAQGL